MEKKEILMIVLIGLLLVTAVVQTVQLVGLSSGNVVVSGAAVSSTSSPAKSSHSSVPTNLQNLPSMVGGC